MACIAGLGGIDFDKGSSDAIELESDIIGCIEGVYGSGAVAGEAGEVTKLELWPDDGSKAGLKLSADADPIGDLCAAPSIESMEAIESDMLGFVAVEPIFLFLLRTTNRTA